MKKVGFFRSIQFKFIIIYILLLLIAVQLIGSYFVRELETELLDAFKGSVSDRVDLLNYNLTDAFNEERSEDEDASTLEEDVQGIVADIDTNPITSLQVINSERRVIGTNDYTINDLIGKKTIDDNVQKAFLYGSSIDTTLLKDDTGEQIYVRADPIYDKDESVIGIIYLEASLEEVYDQVQNINRIIIQGSLLAITVSAILGILVARAFTKPIIEMRQQALTMAEGDFTQKVNVYGYDEISQLADTFNNLNDRLKYSMAAVEKEKQKLSSVLASMSEGVIATDKDGQVTLINDSAGKLIGQNPNKLMGSPLLDLLNIEDRIVDINDLETSGSIIIDLSDDDIYLIRANFSIIYAEDNQVTGFITVLSDVTEEEKMEHERREFVSNVSHELRTPLTTMRSYLEALSDGAWEDKEIAPRFLRVTQNETERMIRLVNDLLQLSRMDHKEYSLHRKRTEFVGYFDSVIERFEMNLEDNIIFERELPSKEYYVWLDEDKMSQVLDNIISNAIKYSPEGGVIRFKVSQIPNRNRELLIRIEDEGLGIPYDKRHKIFERFYRSDRARTRQLGGSGLGLAITKDLVEAHYGRIWVEGTEGKGTTILFTLPLINKRRRGRS